MRPDEHFSSLKPVFCQTTPRLAALLCGGMAVAACAPGGMEMSLNPVVGPRVEITPDRQVSFGPISPLGPMAEKAIRIRSTGDEDVLITGVRLNMAAADDFQVIYDPTPIRLAPDAQVTVTLGFLPTGRGEYDALLYVDLKLDTPFVLDRELLGMGCGDDDEDGRCDMQPTSDDWDTGYN